MLKTIKITAEEKDLLFIRAELFGYSVDLNDNYESIEYSKSVLVFKWNSIHQIYHVLIIFDDDFISALKEIELFKNKRIENIMEEKEVKSDVNELFDRLPGIIKETESDFDRCFEDNNYSAGVRLRKKMKEIEEISRVIRKQSLTNNIKEVSNG